MGDHESELATLRAGIEKAGQETDYWKTEVAGEMAKVAFRDKRIAELESRLSEATRLAVEALEPFVAAFDKRRSAYIRRYSDPAIGRTNFDKMPDKWPMEKIEFSMGAFRRARTALDRLTNIMGESDGRRRSQDEEER